MTNNLFSKLKKKKTKCKLKENYNFSSKEKVAGLYDKDGKLIVSWEDLVNVYHLNIEEHLNSKNYNKEHYSFAFILDKNEKFRQGVSLKLPNDDLIRIGSHAFYKNDTLEEIIVGERIKVIFDNAFSFCKNLKRIFLPQSLTTISYESFLSCKNLEKVCFPKESNVKEINHSAFKDCIKIKSIQIPQKVTKLMLSTFENCKSLERIKLSIELTSIGMSCFSRCVSLKEIYIPPNVVFIDMFAFNETSTFIEIDKRNPFYISSKDGSCIINKKNNALVQTTILPKLPSNIKILDTGCLEYIKTKNLEIPNGVTKILSYAFCHSKIETLIIPNTIDFIGDNILNNCNELKEIHYLGTKEQWRKIHKSLVWDFGLNKNIKILNNENELLNDYF